MAEKFVHWRELSPCSHRAYNAAKQTFAFIMQQNSNLYIQKPKQPSDCWTVHPVAVMHDNHQGADAVTEEEGARFLAESAVG